eukprot:TRINITY_DN15604_c0_g1_i1.p1 TRINITY_DN15604_c0_g1~~TRINITY_DN15604_c0_g1_i1.p1  ORF type:complete len:158 (-),score=39.21 TRINITY_DN15604_c0_g1_i1:65-514(-)
MQCLLSRSCSRAKVQGSQRNFQTVQARDAIKVQASSASTGGSVFIDVRHPSCTKEMSPLGFHQIPHYALKNAVGKGTFSRDQTVYLADTWGLSSCEEAARLLEQKGFTKVNIISGGVVSWGSSGGPITSSSNLAEIEKRYNSKLAASEH